MRAAFPDSTYFCSDHDLLRFLRARHFDLPAARTMFSKYRNVVRPPRRRRPTCPRGSMKCG